MGKRWIGLPVLLATVLLAQSVKERGLALYRDRKFPQAAAALEEHVRQQPKDIASRLLLGLSYQQAGEPGKAVKVFRECPPRGDARYYLARALYEQGRFAESEAAIEESAKLGYSASRLHLLRGLIRIEQSRHHDALASFEAAKQGAAAQDPTPWIHAGQTQLKLGLVGESVRTLEEGLRRNPDNPETAGLLDRARRAAATGAEKRQKREPPVAVRFEDVSKSSGIDFVLQNHRSANKYLPETMAGGLAVFDYNSDGLLDVFFVNGAPLPGMRKVHPRDSHRLYRNLGGFRFEDVTAKAGVAGEGFGIGVAAGDFDQDGHIDLFVAGVHRQQLFRNTGKGSFEDVTARSGIDAPHWAVGAAWLDYDRDGRLDLFVVNYLDWRADREPFCGDQEKSFRVYCHPKNYAPLANRLFRNLGGGRFEDVSAKSGIGSHKGKGMSAAVSDYDGDGWPDIFVPNDTVPNFLFRNDGKGGFEEVALEAGVALTDDGKAVSGMGSDFRDFNNDGWADLVFTALTGETFPLFRNRGPQPPGNPRFEDWTYPSGLGLMTSKMAGWGVALADLNNDGWKDVMAANSHVTDNVEVFSQDRYYQENRVYLNDGGAFVDGGAVGVPAAHRGLVVADLDNDGRLDAVVTVLGGRAEVWRNVTEPVGQWVGVLVEQMGTTVRVEGQTSAFWSAMGYGSSVVAPVHFGLGRQEGAILVEAILPDGRVERREVERANLTVTLAREK